MKELEEVAENEYYGSDTCLFEREAFVAGAKYMQEQMYNEIDIEVAFYEGMNGNLSFSEWLEQFKKK